MKKRVLYCMVLLMSMTAVAQPPTPPRDTIYGREVTYFYIPQWLDESQYDESGVRNVCPLSEGDATTGVDEYAELLVVDTPTTFIGIAACPRILKGEGSAISYLVVRDTDWTHTYEYLRLYQHVHDSMIMVREEIFNLADTSRWMKFCDTITLHHPEVPPGTPHIFPVVERYFDKPITIYDSCYVACTEYNSCRSQNLEDFSLYRYPMTYQCSKAGLRPIRPTAVRNLGTRWYFRVLGNFQLFLFAIFDTTGMGLGPQVVPCGRVENLHVGSSWDGNVLVLWDRAPEHEVWQLAVGRAEADPEGYRVYTLGSTSKVLDGLDSNVLYAARVRARCEGAGNYSEWSDTVQFMLGSGQPEVIGGVADRYTYLVPNPAGESVTVASSYALRYVEVYDLSGRKVMEKECTGVALTLDVSGWPEGTYIVNIRNLQGTATKKLTIAR